MTEATIQLLNDLAEQTHKIQRENGWWDARDKLMQHEHGKEYVAIALCGLAATELSEAIEAIRIGKWTLEKDSVGRELAGNLHRTLDMAAGLGIDIGKCFALELQACKERGHMHGGKKA